jgi:CRISPR-associated protein Csx17
MMYDHVLDGCTPIPLASYLKALGIFRLVAEQVDPEVTGFWRDERFVLRTRLTQDELVRFFAERYEPSPIISPWNGRAGFLEGEEEGDEKSSRQGAAIVRCYERAADRFHKLRDAVKSYRSNEVIAQLDKARAEAKPLQEKKRKKLYLSEDEKNRLKELEASIKRLRASVIVGLRSEAPDSAVDWFDACQRITQERTVFPLLGSGGLDGSRDFGVNFGEALRDLFDFKTGGPFQKTTRLINESLGFDFVFGLGKGNLGQYAPEGIGENISTGFTGEQPFNPVDFIFLLEGTVLFAGAATRRLGSNETRLSFPFTVNALTAGSGAAASADDQNLAEFWAPLWTRPIRFTELASFLTEGRATASGRAARDGLEFAVAVSTLGSQRGVPEYQRFALLQREPRNPKKATPLGRIRVRENQKARLVAGLSDRWLPRVRSVTQAQVSPLNLKAIGRRLDETLFRLAGDGTTDAAQDVLVALGALMLEIGRRPRIRENLPPPPRLPYEWISTADDGSHEFALAAALASLDAATEGGFRLPFRRHLGPLGWPNGRETWVDNTEAQILAVWTGRDLLRDMVAVLERRLIEAQRRIFIHVGETEHSSDRELPLQGRRTAPLASVAAFLADQTDNARIAALTAGLAWVRAASAARSTIEREHVLPFAYTALKPLFVPIWVDPDLQERRTIDPLPLVRLLRAGRADDAVSIAQRLARGAGLPTPFARCGLGRTIDTTRLLAALLFPIAPIAQQRLVARAYPDLSRTEEETDVA